MERLEAFQRWVAGALEYSGLLGSSEFSLAPLSGDAGFRQYHRITGSQTPLLAVDSPPESENNHALVHVAQLLRQYGIRSPVIYAVDYDQGFLLIEDLGDELYLPYLQNRRQDLYRDALACLMKIQSIPVQAVGLPAYNEALLRQEMALFPEWFASQLLDLRLDNKAEALLEDVYARLVTSALEQPQIVVHRDFHSRNLLEVESNNPGVIDFQDAVVGALTYDPVSLFRDCYFLLPEEEVEQWIDTLFDQSAHPDLEGVSKQTFTRWFDWMGLQRHIKVLGIFARLYLRDHKPGYLQDLPLVIHYTRTVAGRYPEFEEFCSWFSEVLMPVIRQQEWYAAIGEAEP